jgi:hypothetical protein
MHWPRYIETAKVPKLAEGPSSAIEPNYPALAEAKEESAKTPKPMVMAKQEKTETTELPKRPAETKEKNGRRTRIKEVGTATKNPEPTARVGVVEGDKNSCNNSKRKRMASVLDVVMESSKVQTPASAPDRKGKMPKKSSEAGATLDTAKAGPSAPIEGAIPLTLEKESAPKEVISSAPEVSAEEMEFIVRHASGKQLSKEEIAEAKQYARDLKYPKRSLVYNDIDEDDFLYCLPNNKEISVCSEMADSIGYPKLELGLSVMSKDQLADILAYNSLKVRMFYLINRLFFVSFLFIVC